MATKKKIHHFLFVIIFTICLTILSQPVYARTSLRMKQRIKTIPCGVDHLTDPDGTEHYFAPRACGKLIVPPSGGASSTTGTGGGISGVAPIYLETKNHAIGQEAYLLLARKGQVYTFRLMGDNVLSPLRTIEVIDVVNNSVTLMFTPGDKEVTLSVGESIDADIAFGGDPDIKIRVKDISPEGLVSMQIWFPLQRKLVGAVDDTLHSAAAVVIIGALSTAAGFLHYHSRKRAGASENNK